MITIHDVAKEAQTSIATVSRVINDLGGYSEATKEKVLKAVESLGYESNAIARSLIVNKTHTIGVVFPNISSMLTYEFLNGIENVAYQKGFSVIVSHTYSKPKRMMESLKNLIEKRVDGIIFASDAVEKEQLEYLKKKKTPVVFLSTKADEESFPYVKVDDYQAAFDVATYLVDKGHTKIGMVAGNPLDLISGVPRIKGFVEGLEQADLSIDNSQITYGADYSFENGRVQFGHLMTKNPQLTAVFLASDEMASGALTMAHEMGIQVPEEVSLIGYDNSLLSRITIPALTTLAQPLVGMGEKACDMLVQMVNKEGQVKSFIMDHHIIERKSVKKLI
ncbi:catabolite control protein A [Alkalibacterium iburiense]|uniref:Catabolite control protein A n=1 Tax=Alkalibacterium iburiense TaxID=290589 RepID=A0ABN0XL98_9LACT